MVNNCFNQTTADFSVFEKGNDGGDNNGTDN